MIDRVQTRPEAPPHPLRPVRDMSGLGVQDASGLHVGALWGALADAETGLIRYLDVSLTDRPRHVLVPIGHARVYDYDRAPEVRLRAALLEELYAIRPYDPEHEIDDALEDDVLHAHGQLFHGERYYAHPAFDHSGLYAGEHPITRSLDSPATSGLQPLAELSGYRVARGEPDVRGWSVAGAEGGLGTVDDLIVDPEAEQVRYLVVQRGEDRVLLPIGFLRLDAVAERVLAPGVQADDLDALPRYHGDVVTRADEDAVRNALERRFTGGRRYLLPDFAANAAD